MADEEVQTPQDSPKPLQHKKWRWLWVLIALVIVVAIAWWYYEAHKRPKPFVVTPQMLESMTAPATSTPYKPSPAVIKSMTANPANSKIPSQKVMQSMAAPNP